MNWRTVRLHQLPLGSFIDKAWDMGSSKYVAEGRRVPGSAGGEVVELETIRSKRKSLNPQTAIELGESSGSASASFGENNKSKPLGYRAQQIRLHFSDEESPIYGNIPIGEVAPVRQNNEQLFSKKKISKSPVRSERRKSKSSAFYSCEEILSSENLCVGEWSSETAECITLLPTKQNSNFQTSKELEEPSCSISFENNLSDSIKVLRVNLHPQSSKPADCKLDEETETYPRRAVMGNRIMLRNVSLHVTGMFRQMLRLRKLIRILKNKVANFFDGEMCHSPRQLGLGTGILGRLDNSRQFMRILPSRRYNRCRGSGPHASRPGLVKSREGVVFRLTFPADEKLKACLECLAQKGPESKSLLEYGKVRYFNHWSAEAPFVARKMRHEGALRIRKNSFNPPERFNKTCATVGREILRDVFMKNQTLRNLEEVSESINPFARSLPSSAEVRLLLLHELRTKQCGKEQLRLRQIGHGEDM
ncbi:hypothetical protein NPIL_570941 [Nephila pilipes]|uniref:Uncharacterized protein n=1 Tax=Nephila pilipes TaxID=299642 RepID=A0A8X6U8S4_NEPPI|nr:hypothetical protein NPIL_570941 [Nephila pilipes]